MWGGRTLVCSRMACDGMSGWDPGQCDEALLVSDREQRLSLVGPLLERSACQFHSQAEIRCRPRPAGRPRAASPVCFSGLCVSAWNFQLQAAGSTSHEPSGRPHRTFMPLHLKSVLTGAESRHILVMPTFSVVTKRIRSRMLKEVGR
jgi:hypothetical protein